MSGPLPRQGLSRMDVATGLGAVVGGVGGLLIGGPPLAIAGGVTGGIVTRSMVFQAGRSWGVYLSRTRIDYRSEIGDPSTNSIVGAVVGWISRNFPDAPVRITKDKEPVVPGLTGPGAMLRLLERPNDWYSGVLQWTATIVDFVVRGNAYWLKIRQPGSDRVIGLWWVPERLMEPKWPQDRKDVFIGWYDYTLDGVVYSIRPRDVVHFRNGIDPLNPRKGLSRLASLFREIFTDEEGANFTASMLRNLGVPGVVISPANTTGPNQRTDPEAVKTSFMEKFGGDKRGEPLVLTGPTDVKVLSFNPEQMQLKDLRRIPEERVSAVTGVPAGVAGLGAGLDRNTFSNYGEANRAAYTQGVIPLHRLIAAELEVQLLPDFAEITENVEWEVFFDASVVAAMADAQDAVWKRSTDAATKALITRAEWKKAVGYEPAPDGADDVYILPNNFTLLEQGEEPPEPKPPQLPPGPPQPPRLGPGGVEGAKEGSVVPAAAPVTCGKCHRMLAELASIPYRFTCPRCKTVNEAA